MVADRQGGGRGGACVCVCLSIDQRPVCAVVVAPGDAASLTAVVRLPHCGVALLYAAPSWPHADTCSLSYWTSRAFKQTKAIWKW